METQPRWWQVILHRIRLLLNPPDNKKNIDRLYSELLMAVKSKYPGETRHETALRYIRAQQHQDNDSCIGCNTPPADCLGTTECKSCR